MCTTAPAVSVPAAIFIDAASENATTPLKDNVPVPPRLTTLPSLDTVKVVAELAKILFTESSDVLPTVTDVIPIAPVIVLDVEASEANVK